MSSVNGQLSMLLCFLSKLPKSSQAPVAHTCNPSYSGGRDQEDHGCKPAWEKLLLRPYLEKTHHRKGLEEWLKV
jgi:hypothetical protein